MPGGGYRVAFAMLAASVLASGGASGAEAQVRPQGATIAGRIADAVAATPLANATVSLEGLALTTISDDQGRYRLDGAPSGPQILRVIRIGYAPLRRPITVPPNGTLTVDIALARSALNLPNIVVTADPAGRARGELGTASVIGSEAIRNQTAASLAGILELIPGTVLQPPGLDGVQQFALRAVPISTGGGIGPNAGGPSAGSLASFGTQVVLDGVPISNNVNLQSLGARAELSFATAAGGGIDLRRIPAATIERVEVIRGIPSARFGDLTQGVVLVDTRAGAVAPEVRLRLDARTTEATVVGGTSLSRRQTATASLNLPAPSSRPAPATIPAAGSAPSWPIASMAPDSPSIPGSIPFRSWRMSPSPRPFLAWRPGAATTESAPPNGLVTGSAVKAGSNGPPRSRATGSAPSRKPLASAARCRLPIASPRAPRTANSSGGSIRPGSMWTATRTSFTPGSS